ncbi:DUF2975 domain-containing protein [Ruminococcaceae bacterium OttesenSCG-928-A16]|nr:DUF2975 domain-containing protein [Ruminococcaceae bacterium OttesenSCG-928-A16]
MWSKKRSLLLSKWVTLLFTLLLAVALVAAPYIAQKFIQASANAHQWQFPLFLLSAYSGGAVAATILVLLYCLLYNIGVGQVFIQKNVSYLRGISWLCILGGVIALASAFYYLPWGIVAAAAAFIGLIVRVVKNVIAAAIALKEENDYTI